MTNLRLILMYSPIINPVFDKYMERRKEGQKIISLLHGFPTFLKEIEYIKLLIKDKM